MEPEDPKYLTQRIDLWRGAEERLEILESRFALLVIDVRELLTIMKDEPSLIARRPHLAREIATIEARLRGAPSKRVSWWRRGKRP